MLKNKIMEILNIEICMNTKEYNDYKQGSTTLLDIYIDNNKEVLKKAEKYIVIGLAFSLTVSSKYMESFSNFGPAVACGGGLGGIDALGNKMLGIIRGGGYWLLLIRGIIELIKESQKGSESLAAMGKVIITYVLLFASLYLIPILFDEVSNCFGG